MKKGIKYLVVLFSAVFLLTVSIPAQSLISQEQADNIQLISVTPPKGTILQRGTEVPFEVTVAYNLVSKATGFVGVELALPDGKSVEIGDEIEIRQGSGTAVIKGSVDVEHLYNWVKTDTVFLTIEIGYLGYLEDPRSAFLFIWECMPECPYYIEGEAPPENQPPINDVDEEQSIIEGEAPQENNITLVQLIQQKKIKKVPVTVDNQEYYIVTINCRIDPKTLECLPDSGPTKIYVDGEQNPVSDVWIARKIGWVDWAREIQKEDFNFQNLISEIEEGRNKLVMFDGAYTMWETGFKAIPTGFGIKSLINMILGVITSDLNKMETFRNQAESYLNNASSEYGQAEAVLRNNQDITNSQIAYDFLKHYLWGNYYKSHVFIIIQNLYEYYVSVGSMVEDIIAKAGSSIPSYFGFLAKAFEQLEELSKGLEFELDYIRESISVLPDVSLRLLHPPTEGFCYTNELAHSSLLKVTVKSPIELRVYDSEDNITGLVNREIKEEIPNSIYDAENKEVIIFSTEDINSYCYEAVGTDTGTYGLEITSVENGEATTFTTTNIPTTASTIHQYIINWGVLSQGEKGATLQIDSDGDGTFEKTFTADSEFKYNKFVFFLQKETAGLSLWIWIAGGAGITLILVISYILTKRRLVR